jgi:integrase/recombinase XerC
MNQLLSSFDEYLRLERRRSPDTAKCYVAVATSLIGYLPDAERDADQRLAQATTDDLRAFLLKSAATKAGVLSGHMWNQKLAALRTLFRFLVKRKFAPSNPALDLEPTEAESRQKVPLTLAEFATFIGAINQGTEPYRSRDVALAQVAFHCALRVSELRRLDFAHFDFQHRLIVNLLVKGQKFLVVPFPPIVADAIQRYLAERDRFHPTPGEPAVFLSERGQRLSIRQIEALVPTYAERAGILRRVTPHYLRHSVATAHAQRGTKPEDVQRLLGHESLATTKRYIHTMDTLCEAVDALGEEVEALLESGVGSASAVPPRGPPPRSGLSLLTGEASAASL